MAEQWYYTTGGTQAGPVSWDELRAMAAQKSLAPGDLVWNEDMPEWAEARTVAGLLPAKGPPPLPNRPASPPPPPPASPVGQAWVAVVMEAYTGPPGESGPDKFVVSIDQWNLGTGTLRDGFRVGWNGLTGVRALKLTPSRGVVSRLFGFVRGDEAPAQEERVYRVEFPEPGNYDVRFVFDEPRTPLAMPVTATVMKTGDLGPGLGTLIGKGWSALSQGMTDHFEAVRRGKINALWRQVGDRGMWFMFTKDGAMLRQDGLAAKYRWLDNETVELYEDGTEATVRLQILSMTDSELLVKTGGQSGHFYRNRTITQAVERQRQKEAEQAVKDFALGAAKVAGGVAGVLAVGGIVVLCGVAGTVAVLGAADGGGAGSFGSPSSSPRTPKPASLPPAREDAPARAAPERRAEAVAVRGAVVVGYEGERVVIRHKCESCGTVQPGQTVMGFSSAVTAGGFVCHRCHSQQEYAIRGTA